MAQRAPQILRIFPPRPLGPEERLLVQSWLAACQDIKSAYVSERRSDKPEFLHRVVISAGGTHHPTHTIHAPNGPQWWLLIPLDDPDEVQQFTTLRQALNSIKAVFA